MSNTIKSNELFPVFVKMSDIHSLIVGGGNVALEKLTAILSNSPQAKIHLVAPSIKPEIIELIKGHPTCKYTIRSYLEEDILGMDLIFLTTDDPILHRAIKSTACEQHILVNTADTPDLCDFYLSSIVKKGNLKIAISTNGMSPTLAKRIKEMLHASIPDDINHSLDNLHEIRTTLKGDFDSKIKALNKITDQMTTSKSKPKYGNSLQKLVLFCMALAIGFVLGLLYKYIVT